RAEILKSDGKPLPLGLRLAVALGEFFVYGPVRDQLGLRRARWALTGGSPLGPDTFRFFRAIGVNLKQVYGSTETTGLVSLQPSAEANPTTAGRPCAGIDVRIAERGEVLVKSAGIFRGYLKNEEATREVIDEDGWFHTGDAGFIDPRGHLVIIDRAKDVGALVDVTRTRKVRRGYVAEKYATVIDAFYGGRDEVELTTTITYEDGRQAALRSLARVQDAEEIAAHG